MHSQFKRTSAWAAVRAWNDGRSIAIAYIPMADGGWVATHEDVTQLRNAEMAVERAAKEAEAARTRLIGAFDVVPEGLVLFDKEDRCVLWNRRYIELYPASRNSITVGAHFEDVLRAGLASGQYAEAVGREESWLAERMARYHAGQSSHEQLLGDGRWVRIEERRTADGGAIGVRVDITELKRREQELRDQNARFSAALNNIFQGLCFFDGTQKLIVCNRRYAEMYNLDPELVRPGITLREIIDYRYAAGSGPADMSKEQYHTWLSAIAAASGPHDTVTELENGKIFEVHQRPMSDGGWVATLEDITARRRTEARIHHLAHHDALTNLPNRVLLHKRLEEACERAGQTSSVAVLCLDLDRFKEVNDTLGHATGDMLLKAVAGRLSACLRQDDTLARMGGDEFAILQTNVLQPKSATTLADRVIETLTAPFEVNGHQMLVGTSVGISVAPNDGTDAGELLKKADLALYQAKGTRRGSYRFFEPGMDALMQARRQLEAELRQAVATSAFELYFQPIVDLDNDRVSECEALVRWRHPERGIVAPGEFIPLAEEIGLVAAIGEWVLHAACTQAATWPPGIGISVNLSPAQFDQGDLTEIVAHALTLSGLSPHRLMLEITESILLENTSEVLATLARLRDLGVRIAMDDFGIGFSSLSSLSKFPFSKIKIDKSFVAGLGQSEHSAAIIEAVATLGARLDMITTAEGVETADQLAWLRAIGISEVQGYFIGRPQAAPEVAKMIATAAKNMQSAA